VDISSIAVQGLQQAQALMDQATQRLSTAGGTTSGTDTDTVSLSEAAVALLSAKNEFAANVNVLKIADNMQKSLVDILG